MESISRKYSTQKISDIIENIDVMEFSTENFTGELVNYLVDSGVTYCPAFGDITNIQSQLMELSRFDTFVCFDFSLLDNAVNSNAMWSDINHLCEIFMITRNTILGYNYGNNMCKIRYMDKLFTFRIYDNYSIEINFRDETGSQSIVSIETKDDCITREQVNLIKKHLQNYCKGIISCSDCGKSIDKSDIAGRYYAGTYCNECWDKKWKEIASKDNYE